MTAPDRPQPRPKVSKGPYDYPSPMDREGYIVMLVEAEHPGASDYYVVTREADNKGIGSSLTPEGVDIMITKDRATPRASRVVYGRGVVTDPPEVGLPVPPLSDLVQP